MTKQTLQRHGPSAPASSRAPSAFAPRGFGDTLSRLPAPAPQAKLTVNQPGDKYEQEADAVADRVLRMGDAAPVQREDAEEEEEQVQAKPLAGAISPLVQREGEEEDEDEEDRKPVQAKALSGASSLLQRDPAPEEEDPSQTQASTPAPDAAQGHSEAQTPKTQGQEPDEEQAQRKETGGSQSSDVSGVVSQGLSGGGQPLDDSTRAYMEPRFGHDFSQVRIHTDARASESSEQIAARAYTVGSDIAFRSGEFSPGSSDGRHLLAHELTHVVQQNGAEPAKTFRKEEVKSLPKWGSTSNTIGSNYSNMKMNPHAELWLNGRWADHNWFPANPADTNARFTIPAETKAGEVKIVIDGSWFQNNTWGNEEGHGTSIVTFPFKVNEKHETHFGLPMPELQPVGKAASMTQTFASMDIPPDGGEVTSGLAINSTDSNTAGHTITGNASPGGLGGSAGMSSTVTTPTANALRQTYKVALTLEKPKTELFSSSNFVTFGINKHKIIQDKLQGQSILDIYDFVNKQPEDVKKLIKDGTIEINVQAHASRTGNIGDNMELSERRRDEVVRMFKNVSPHVKLNPTAVGDIEADEKGEKEGERRVDMSFSFQRTPPAAGSGAAPAP